MSKLLDLLKSGRVPTVEDWTEFMVEHHRAHPGSTARAISRFKSTDGRNSYEILADSFELSSSAPLILDLACGDGPMTPYLLKRAGAHGKVIGVDLSVDELQLAEKKHADERISFVHADARALPFANETFDSIACHMAFMIVIPVEPMISEIHRVLKRGGSFHAVMPGVGSAQGLWRRTISDAIDFISKLYPAFPSMKTGDPRASTYEGLVSLFKKEMGWQPVSKLVELELSIRETIDEAWTSFDERYILAAIPTPEREEMKKRFIEIAKSLLDDEGLVSLSSPIRMFSVEKS